PETGFLGGLSRLHSQGTVSPSPVLSLAHGASQLAELRHRRARDARGNEPPEGTERRSGPEDLLPALCPALRQAALGRQDSGLCVPDRSLGRGAAGGTLRAHRARLSRRGRLDQAALVFP